MRLHISGRNLGTETGHRAGHHENLSSV